MRILAHLHALFLPLTFQYNFILSWINPKLVCIQLYTCNSLFLINMYCNYIFIFMPSFALPAVDTCILLPFFFHFLWIVTTSFYTLWQWCRTLNIIFPHDQMHQKTHQFPLLFSPCLSLSSVTLSPCHMAVDLRFALLSLASPSPSLLCYIFCSLKPKSFLFLSSPRPPFVEICLLVVSW